MLKFVFASMLLLAVALANPYTPDFALSVPEAAKDLVEKVVRWMVHSVMHDDAWVLRLLFEAHCESCAEFLTDLEDDTESWHQTCNECVEPFWPQMQEMEGCEVCRHSSKDCHVCKASVGALYTEKLGSMEQLAKPYFEKLHFLQQ